MENKKILIADDDILFSKSLEEKFKKEGLQTVVINDPLKAIETIKSENPDLIFLDIMMPGKSGMEIIDELFQKQELEILKKVIIMTSLEDNTHVSDAVGYGVTRYIQKSTSTLDSIFDLAKSCLS